MSTSTEDQAAFEAYMTPDREAALREQLAQYSRAPIARVPDARKGAIEAALAWLDDIRAGR